MRRSHHSTGGSSLSGIRSSSTARMARGSRPPSAAMRAASSRCGNAGGEYRACSSRARRSSWSCDNFQCCAIAAMNLSPTPRPLLTTREMCALEKRIARCSSACPPGRAVSLRTRRTTYSATSRRRFSASMPPEVPESAIALAKTQSRGFLDLRVCPSYLRRLRVSTDRGRNHRPRSSMGPAQLLAALPGIARHAEHIASHFLYVGNSERAISSSPRDSSDVPASPGLSGEGGRRV
jgi:hypothetical protein